MHRTESEVPACRLGLRDTIADALTASPVSYAETARVTFIAVPGITHEQWWPQLAVYLDAVRDAGGRVVAEGHLLHEPVAGRRARARQARLAKHASDVAGALSPHGWVDSSGVLPYSTEDDIVVHNERDRLMAWRWWHLLLELPIHLFLLRRRPPRTFALEWEWFDSAENQAWTRVARAEALLEAARAVDGDTVVLVSPMMAAYLGVTEPDGWQEPSATSESVRFPRSRPVRSAPLPKIHPQHRERFVL
ncbi:hypothetical protein HD599_003219 [Conyzicola lurida]|uniref:Uncharacterized protein n=1 Tax=Conyzicola lurida TaxID=1172621 RepID=A0A841AT92_9MICO|nr:hypothetical protein [Conyzicola lurida]